MDYRDPVTGIDYMRAAKLALAFLALCAGYTLFCYLLIGAGAMILWMSFILVMSRAFRKSFRSWVYHTDEEEKAE